MLFRAACELGALEADGDAEALGAFGERIGLAFQILDDVLDVSGPPERTGKPRGADLLDGTVTLPLILARERDPSLPPLDLRGVSTAGAAADVCDRIAATGALDDARSRAQDVGGRGQARTAGTCASPARGARARGRRDGRAVRLTRAARRRGPAP